MFSITTLRPNFGVWSVIVEEICTFLTLTLCIKTSVKGFCALCSQHPVIYTACDSRSNMCLRIGLFLVHMSSSTSFHSRAAFYIG